MKVGIIGTGFMGKTHMEAIKSIDNLELTAITGRDKTKGNQIANEFGCDFYTSVEEMVNRPDIDIIDVCVPTYLHEKFCLMAFSAGKHVICEKPFTLTLESADRVIKTAKKANVKFMVAQVLRFWPEYMKIKESYDNGGLGDVGLVYANRLAQTPDWNTEWFSAPDKSGGALFDLHIHDLDFVHYLFGPEESVYAVGKQSDTGTWDHIMTTIKYKNGTSAVIEGSTIMPDGYPFTMTFRMLGSKSSIDFSFKAGLNIENRDSADDSFVVFQKGKEPKKFDVEKTDPFINELQYFANCIEEGKNPEIVMPGESRDILKVVLAIKESLETGKVIKVNE